MPILHCHALSPDRYHLHIGTAGSDSSQLVARASVTVPVTVPLAHVQLCAMRFLFTGLSVDLFDG